MFICAYDMVQVSDTSNTCRGVMFGQQIDLCISLLSHFCPRINLWISFRPEVV